MLDSDTLTGTGMAVATPEFLAAMLKLPDTTKIVGCEWDTQATGGPFLKIYVRDHRLPFAADAQPTPIKVIYMLESKPDEERSIVFYRWEVLP